MSKTKKTTATGEEIFSLQCIFAGSGRRHAAKIPTMITLPLALSVFFLNEPMQKRTAMLENFEIDLEFINTGRYFS
jgi:hypothetical protein